MSMNSTHTPFLMRTFDIAKNAVHNGNHPFGALLVLDGEIVFESENSVNSEHDVTRHAELNLISLASKEISSTEFQRAILYSSTEPCAMCAGAIYWAGIRNVVFGCSSAKLEVIAKGGLAIDCRSIFSRTTEPVYVDGPLIEDVASEIHRKFW